MTVTDEQTQKSSCADTDKENDRITRISKVKCRQVVRTTQRKTVTSRYRHIIDTVENKRCRLTEIHSIYGFTF